MALQNAELVKYKNTASILQKEAERLQREVELKNQKLEVQRK